MTLHSPLLKTYKKRCQSGELTWDAQQNHTLEQLAPLFKDLHHSNIFCLLGFVNPFSSAAKKSQGAYIYGEAGRGKTVLMDLFFTCTTRPKKRAHFHEFMQEIHHARHTHQGQPDPLRSAVQEVCTHIKLLCLDEMEVKDIGDALILGRVIEQLLNQHVMVITTSNRPVENLYLGGLHRDRFLPTITLMRTSLMTINLNSPIDYRMQAQGKAHAFWPLNAISAKKFNTLFEQLTNHRPLTSHMVTSWERPLTFKNHAMGVLKTTFTQLCGSSLSSGDYLALATGIHTILLDEIPLVETLPRDELRRFILLIDVLYDKQTKLYMRMEKPLDQWDIHSNPWAFEFKRTYSRLLEMQGW